MKDTYKIYRKISLLFYIFILFQLWHLCQYGGVRKHLLLLVLGGTGFLISFILWLIFRKHKQEYSAKDSMKKNIMRIEIIILLIGTVYFGGRIIDSAIPYHGALSWKVAEWMKKKEVKLTHNQLFETGVEGILNDLDKSLNLPDELYIANQYQMTFDEQGTIKTIDTFLYGRDESGKTKTYLVNYDADKNKKMTIWVDGEANADYDDNMRLEPMLTILEKADYKQQVKSWSEDDKTNCYELLYLGRRSFKSEEGLRVLLDDTKKDSTNSQTNNLAQLQSGGEVIGFEVSLHIPTKKEITPVRYMIEPKYVSSEELSQGQKVQQIEDAKDTKSWNVDKTDGTMYFFLDDNRGWRFVVTDAAAGSRFYGMEKTKDGGTTWESINADPFQGKIGVTEGLLFFNESFGIAGLTGASQSDSQLYVTKDGGVTFMKLQLPMEEVTQLPKFAGDYQPTVDDYDYFYMPDKKDDILTIKVVTEAGEKEGLLFQSKDNAETWEYTGITED